MRSVSGVSGYFVFFFSSRRRHTRCSRDWSSDVCSSDLLCAVARREKGLGEICMATNTYDAIVVGSGITGGWAAKELTEKGLNTLVLEEIGRASCRERV